MLHAQVAEVIPAEVVLSIYTPVFLQAWSRSTGVHIARRGQPAWPHLRQARPGEAWTPGAPCQQLWQPPARWPGTESWPLPPSLPCLAPSLPYQSAPKTQIRATGREWTTLHSLPVWRHGCRRGGTRTAQARIWRAWSTPTPQPQPSASALSCRNCGTSCHWCCWASRLRLSFVFEAVSASSGGVPGPLKNRTAGSLRSPKLASNIFISCSNAQCLNLYQWIEQAFAARNM